MFAPHFVECLEGDSEAIQRFKVLVNVPQRLSMAASEDSWRKQQEKK